MSELLREQIENTMGFHPGHAGVAPLYEELRRRFIAVGHFVNENCPDGRIKSLAITKLEEALMRAIQSVAAEQPLGDEKR